MKNIDYSLKVPYYQQLYEIMREKILKGEWKPGDMIPPESELIEKYQMSRTTVRQTLKLLVNDGLIYRQQGRGSFVAHFTLKRGLTNIVSFTEDMKQRGYQPETKTIFFAEVKADEQLAAELQITPGEELICLKRLRLADGEPLSIEISHLVSKYCPGILKYDFSRAPLKERLEKTFNLYLIRAEQLIKAINAPLEMARELEIKKGTALLYLERVSFSQKNIPVEFLQIYYRGDRYSLFNELKGNYNGNLL